MLKSVGEKTAPCGTPVLSWCCVDVVFLKYISFDVIVNKLVDDVDV